MRRGLVVVRVDRPVRPLRVSEKTSWSQKHKSGDLVSVCKDYPEGIEGYLTSCSTKNCDCYGPVTNEGPNKPCLFGFGMCRHFHFIYLNRDSSKRRYHILPFGPSVKVYLVVPSFWSEIYCKIRIKLSVFCSFRYLYYKKLDLPRHLNLRVLLTY